MMIAAAFFAAVAIFYRTSAEIVSTSLLLPNVLFTFEQSFQPPTFVGQVTVVMSTTYYTLDCYVGGAAYYFTPLYDCETSSRSYTFSETSGSTQYVHDNVETSFGTGTALASEDDVTQIETIDCGPLGISGSATCTTTSESEDSNSIEINSTYTTGPESSIYTVLFSTAVGYGTTSSTVTTSATPSPTALAPTAKSTTGSSSNTTANSPLGPSSKVGIGLGVPLGACALAGLALLLHRHTKHKERSRKRQMDNLPPPPAIAANSDAKRLSEAGVMGRQPPVYSMEMQG